MDKTEVRLDFHIFAILEFDLLLGYPFEKLFQEKSSHGSLNEEFGKITSATHLDNSKVEHHPNNDPFEEVKFITPFISPSPSLEPKPCPSGHQDVVLDSSQDGISLVILFTKFKKASFFSVQINSNRAISNLPTIDN